MINSLPRSRNSLSRTFKRGPMGERRRLRPGSTGIRVSARNRQEICRLRSTASVSAYSHQRQFNRALQAWSKNADVNPQFAPSRVCVAEIYERRGDWEKAADEYAAILKFDKGLVAARIALAEAQKRGGKWKEAEAELRLAADQAPSYWLIRERLGDLLQDRGSPEARDQYQMARAKAFDKSDKKRLKNKIDNLTKGNRLSVSKCAISAKNVLLSLNVFVTLPLQKDSRAHW